MKISKVEHFKDPETKGLNEVISKREHEGYELSQVVSSAAGSDGFSKSCFLTLVFTKEEGNQCN